MVNAGRIKVESIAMETAKRYILKGIPDFLQKSVRFLYSYILIVPLFSFSLLDIGSVSKFSVLK